MSTKNPQNGDEKVVLEPCASHLPENSAGIGTLPLLQHRCCACRVAEVS